MTLALWFDLAIPRIVGWKSLTVEAAPARPDVGYLRMEIID